jgi:uncharacterized protein YraI
MMMAAWLKKGILGLLFCLIPVFVLVAQEGIPGTTLDTINVRSGPGNEYGVIGSLPINTSVTIVGRNPIGDRLLVTDGTLRGWVASRYVGWAEATTPLGNIPVTGEIIGGAAVPEAALPATPAPDNNPSVVPSGNGTPGRILAGTLNLRKGPSGEYETLVQLAINTNVLIEGRNNIGNWLLVNTGSGRGWAAARYVGWDNSIALSSFPVTGEIIGGTPAENTNTTAPAVAPVVAAVPTGNGTPARILATNLNLRTGPGSEYAVLAQLPLNANVLIEGRNGIGNWGLINTGDLRGWVATRFLSWDATIDVSTFPVTGEIIGANPLSTSGEGAGGEVPPVVAPVVTGNQGTVIAATLNVRQGSTNTQPQIGTLNRGMTVAIEARNSVGDWILVNTGSLRGWVATRFVNLPNTFNLGNLPVSSEVIGVTPAVANPAEGGAAANPLAVSGDIAALEAQLAAVPVVPPGITARTQALFAAARRAGRNMQRFTKVGDCNSENLAFMYGFDWDNYSLGAYGGLQSTIDYFNGSFAQASVAGRVGYSAVTVIDALWADPAVCRSGEAPVFCELRTSNAAFVVIMFGANDISILTTERYESAMRRILDLSIQANVVPILSTFPTDPAQPDRWLKALQLNVITVNLAREYDLPVMNFWLAAKNLPSAGMAGDNAHLTTHSGSSIVFDGSTENAFGFTARNLVVLQTLDVIRRGLGM